MKTNKITELKFQFEKIRYSYRLAKQLLVHEKMEVIEDFLTSNYLAEMEAYFLRRSQETIKIEYDLKRPSFFDWLLRRKKRLVYWLHVDDLKINPPEMKETYRIYDLKFDKIENIK